MTRSHRRRRPRKTAEVNHSHETRDTDEPSLDRRAGRLWSKLLVLIPFGVTAVLVRSSYENRADFVNVSGYAATGLLFLRLLCSAFGCGGPIRRCQTPWTNSPQVESMEAKRCRRCRREISSPTVDTDRVFEGMHVLCFHLEYEHTGDPDWPCADPGCFVLQRRLFADKLTELGIDTQTVLQDAVKTRQGQRKSPDEFRPTASMLFCAPRDRVPRCFIRETVLEPANERIVTRSRLRAVFLAADFRR